MAWTRRRFITAGALGLIGAAFTDAFWFERSFIRLNEFDRTAKVPGAPLKLIQISDLHIREIGAPLRRLAERINEIGPELILFTGDSIDDPKKMHVLNAFLRLLDPDTQKAAILGNWEYWGKIDKAEIAYTYNDHKCDLLINDSRRYHFGSRTVTVTGVDDYIAGNADIDIATRTVEAPETHVILNHCPEYSDIIASRLHIRSKNDLILSGHTHGGQVNLFGFTPLLPAGCGSYLKGWYRCGDFDMYVSKGIGTSILPMRFGARAEAAVFIV